MRHPWATFWPADPDRCLLDEDADDVLLGLLARDTEPEPWHVPRERQPPPPRVNFGGHYFDKAEFLAHMQGLIRRREQEEFDRLEQARLAEERERREALERQAAEHAAKQAEFAKERAALARLVAQEAQKNEPKPAPKPIYSHYVINSPSYAPLPLPTADELCAIAQRALQHLLMCRQPQFLGVPWLGKWATSVVFTRDGGSVTEAIDRIVRELPARAHLSGRPVPVEPGVLGGNATNPYASLRAMLSPDGQSLRFDVTWDDPTSPS